MNPSKINVFLYHLNNIFTFAFVLGAISQVDLSAVSLSLLLLPQAIHCDSLFVDNFPVF
jgi:hypothetical protein